MDFGFEFRPGQKEVLDRLERGISQLVIMPTGWGKSLLYFWPAINAKKKILVISPLLSLIADQKIRAQNFGLIVGEENPFQNLMEYNWQIVFLTPERFMAYSKLKKFSALKYDVLVLDEAHCILEWRFRTDYLRLKKIIRELPTKVTILALSATLDRTQEAELGERIGRSLEIFRIGRKFVNAKLGLMACEGRGQNYFNLLKALKNYGAQESAIIYCQSRKEVERVKDFLLGAGLGVVDFHAGISRRQKQNTVKDFIDGRSKIVIATSAFGLGIDYPHVRLIVHFGMPYSRAQYWQEIGRAGRDGASARAELIWSLSDFSKRRVMTREEYEETMALVDMWQGKGCRRTDLDRYRIADGIEEAGNCGNCDNCLNETRECPWWLENKALLREFLGTFIEIRACVGTALDEI